MLDDDEIAVLQFVCAAHAHSGFERFLDHYNDIHFDVAADLVSIATGLPKTRARRVFAATARLIHSGLIEVDPDAAHTVNRKLTPKHGLVDAVLTPGLDRGGLLTRYLPRVENSSLTWNDVSHLDLEARTLRDLLAAAIRSRSAGINVLLHGPTGTGKTELAKLLAQDLACELYACGVADDNGESADASERLSSLMLGQALVANDQAILIFDELEDLFQWEASGGRRAARMSKLWFNLMLERNPVPTVWICNETSGIDRAFLRRFSYAIEFGPLGVSQRTRVLQRHLDGRSALTADDAEAVARRFPDSAALFANAVRSARMIAPNHSPDRELVERMMQPISKLVNGCDPPRHREVDPSHYHLDMLNASADIGAVAECAARSAVPALSLCLYGPPGTGKSAFTHHLARMLKRPVHEKRVSDILGPYLGQSEQAIAGAFRDAERDGAVLLFDEADSFLRNRSAARHSWEVTQTNEFLEQLDSFRGVVVCTTNLVGVLDDAARRRFTFSIEFRPLRPEQAIVMFERVFACHVVSDENRERVRAALRGVSTLTLGDFTLVEKRAHALGDTLGVPEIIEALLAEARNKPGARRVAGFAQTLAS